jgi:hypothetical protein
MTEGHLMTVLLIDVNKKLYALYSLPNIIRIKKKD